MINTAEIYLAQEEESQNKEIENPTNSSKWKYRKESKGNKLKAPYNDRKGVENKPKWFEKPFYYSQPNESLFYREMMARFKKTAKLKYARKQPQKVKRTKSSGKQGASLNANECEDKHRMRLASKATGQLA